MSALVGWPRTLVHEGLSGGGAPLVVAGKVGDAIAEKYARFSFACLQPGYLYSTQRFALDAIRALNPQIKIWTHLVLHSVWGQPGVDSGYQSRYAEICARPGGVWSGTKRPNLTRPDRLGEIIDLWSEVLDSGAFDGVMLDPTCAVNVSDWSDGGRFKTETECLAAQRAALGQIFATLRRRHPNLILIGCGGPKGDYPGGSDANGWWLENVWEQNPQGWAPATRLCFDAPYYYTAPHYNVIAMARSAPDPQAMRFGLGTSCLFDGIYTIGPGDFKGSAHLDWTIPEYFPAGWLGQPLGAPWPLNTTTWQRTFEHGEVAVSTLARDAVFKRY